MQTATFRGRTSPWPGEGDDFLPSSSARHGPETLGLHPRIAALPIMSSAKFLHIQQLSPSLWYSLFLVHGTSSA
ncbi:uncharacterized protein PgNI_07691 [Pyricularia grisea]|uniref:Uncharacterized protein n=1 Tax=Pyricularia grisea TaxID=148305 RepID=A0A6P8B367_PYRGI|nr:uncharacterized protein PgNI_07691 [Pyricularia grisea]TLD09311.1 hypothetical protein PgNI_07691 [Pyricularia grisea]